MGCPANCGVTIRVRLQDRVPGRREIRRFQGAPGERKTLAFMYQTRLGARAEYRQQQRQLASDSTSLAETFRDLKSLSLDLSYFGPHSPTRTSEIKYSVNLAHAKSLFRFECQNTECVGGDWDLSAELARAVSTRRTALSGEMICQGWRSKATIDKVRCNNILRYNLSLGY